MIFDHVYYYFQSDTLNVYLLALIDSWTTTNSVSLKEIVAATVAEKCRQCEFIYGYESVSSCRDCCGNIFIAVKEETHS